MNQKKIIKEIESMSIEELGSKREELRNKRIKIEEMIEQAEKNNYTIYKATLGKPSSSRVQSITHTEQALA